MRLSLTIGIAALAAAVVVPAGTSMTPGAPVKKITVSPFGAVLATKKRQALYFWQVEKKAGGKVRCTGSCATAWPPLIVRSRSAVPKKIAGIKGTFGTVRRLNGKLQVTRNRLPLYTYAHERPGQVLCDDVNGWFVVRI